MKRPQVDQFNFLPLYAAGIVWTYMLMIWIVVVVRLYFLVNPN
jgi:hypothetical protein